MELVALVERARAGDPDAFTELVRRHQRPALAVAVALLRDSDLARDVVQEAFVAAWRGLARLADPSAFPAWLQGIVRRQALHLLRARPLEPLGELDRLASEAPRPSSGWKPPGGAGGPGPRRACSRRASRSEPYTKRPGSFVRRAEALAACAAILDGVHDDVPEEAFYFTGGIDEVLARARAAG